MKNNNNIEQSYVFDQAQMHLIPNHNILEQFRALKTKDEFLELLNAILVIELGKSSKKKFTKSQLDYFLARLAGNDDSSKRSLKLDIYSTFEIKKKSNTNNPTVIFSVDFHNKDNDNDLISLKKILDLISFILLNSINRAIFPFQALWSILSEASSLSACCTLKRIICVIKLKPSN
jgi:hypothetical protein